MEFNATKQTIEEATRTINQEGGEAFEPADPRLALYKRTINQLLEDSYYESDEEHLLALVQRFDAAANEDHEFVLKLAAYARQVGIDPDLEGRIEPTTVPAGDSDSNIDTEGLRWGNR